jgi:hypothetical protein
LAAGGFKKREALTSITHPVDSTARHEREGYVPAQQRGVVCGGGEAVAARHWSA